MKKNLKVSLRSRLFELRSTSLVVNVNHQNAFYSCIAIFNYPTVDSLIDTFVTVT